MKSTSEIQKPKPPNDEVEAHKGEHSTVVHKATGSNPTCSGGCVFFSSKNHFIARERCQGNTKIPFLESVFKNERLLGTRNSILFAQHSRPPLTDTKAVASRETLAEIAATTFKLPSWRHRSMDGCSFVSSFLRRTLHRVQMRLGPGWLQESSGFSCHGFEPHRSSE